MTLVPCFSLPINHPFRHIEIRFFILAGDGRSYQAIADECVRHYLHCYDL